MNMHKNARLTPYRRAQLVAQLAQGIPLSVAARAFGVSRYISPTVNMPSGMLTLNNERPDRGRQRSR